mmetsp:Transcript_29091/g.53023  ORF Transcript_29091/g.53023 Transcript_29091/m.53023 type:complete len:210 (-) Transcript_29091:87-716(-)
MAIFVLAVVATCLVPLASAFTTNRNKIPNGNSVMRGGSSWFGVGHCTSGGGGQCLNPFGEAFKAAGQVWTTALCEADSDGDGQTNGFELGDPDCTWVQGGAAPSRITDISHPGFSDSMTSATMPDDTDDTMDDNTTDMDENMDDNTDGNMGDMDESSDMDGMMNNTDMQDGTSTMPTMQGNSGSESDAAAAMLHFNALVGLLVSAALAM